LFNKQLEYRQRHIFDPYNRSGLVEISRRRFNFLKHCRFRRIPVAYTVLTRELNEKLLKTLETKLIYWLACFFRFLRNTLYTLHASWCYQMDRRNFFLCLQYMITSGDD